MTAVDQRDVVIVGAGPVGLVLACLLGQVGRTVTVLERHGAPYARPRAVHFDHEIARVLHAAGLGEDVLQGISEPAPSYEWQNAAGQTLLSFDWRGIGPSGWPVANMFAQPDLERELEAAVTAHGSVELRRGEEVVALDATDGGAVVRTVGPGHSREHHGRFVVGCDGANSTVASLCGIGRHDLGFAFDWLIVDLRPHDDRVWDPMLLQVCDPRRPTTVVSGGPGRRRWEFMRLPHETVEELVDEDRVWSLLAPWGYTPDNADLERRTVYTFGARWAERWRAGPVLLAGDAAHLMPPFAGQGMCSGLRDAANLAWKLDLVLDGRAGPSLLDTYEPERSGHVQSAIAMSVELGRVICTSDAAEAAERDRRMLAAGGDPEKALPPSPPPVLAQGLVDARPDRSPAGAALAGTLGEQHRVRAGGAIGRFDEVVGRGFAVVGLPGSVDHLAPSDRSALQALGAHVVELELSDGDPRNPEAVVDADGGYERWLSGAGCVGAVVRPDFYVFGAGATDRELAAVVGELVRQLHEVGWPGPVPAVGPEA